MKKIISGSTICEDNFKKLRQKNMIKTFEVIYSVDESYRGNGIIINPNWTVQIDEKINNFIKENLKAIRINMYYPYFAYTKQQYGTDPRNTETKTFFIVAISYHEV